MQSLISLRWCGYAAFIATMILSSGCSKSFGERKGELSETKIVITSPTNVTVSTNYRFTAGRPLPQRRYAINCTLTWGPPPQEMILTRLTDGEGTTFPAEGAAQKEIVIERTHKPLRTGDVLKYDVYLSEGIEDKDTSKPGAGKLKNISKVVAGEVKAP